MDQCFYVLFVKGVNALSTSLFTGDSLKEVVQKFGKTEGITSFEDILAVLGEYDSDGKSCVLTEYTVSHGFLSHSHLEDIVEKKFRITDSKIIVERTGEVVNPAY